MQAHFAANHAVACNICISVETPGLSKQVLSGLVTYSMGISDTTFKSMAGQMARQIQLHVCIKSTLFLSV